MLRKQTPPMIGKLSELFVSGGGRAVAFFDSTRSPISTLDTKMQSPRGLKNYDLGGVGLKIVVALDKSCDREVLPKHAVCTSSLNRSRPIPVKNPDINLFQRDLSVDEIDMDEEYTYVTCHMPNKTFTKVYYGEGDFQTHVYNNNVGVFRRPQSPIFIEREKPSFLSSNFLSSCHLCGKKLHGKDIYMYRGEKGFCSTECRSSQIMMDERKERCGSEAELSSSPYTRDQIFSTGILAL